MKKEVSKGCSQRRGAPPPDEGVAMIHVSSPGWAPVYGGPNMYPVADRPGWFTSATPSHLQTDEDKYVIRWGLEPKSYFCRMTDIGPMFGVSLAETPRFDSVREAQRVIDGFSMVAEAGSEIETVRGRLSLSRNTV